MAQEFKVEGLADLERGLAQLRETFGTKTGGVVIRGLRAGMRVIQEEAKRRAPLKDPRNLVAERVIRLAEQSGKLSVGRKKRIKGQITRSLALIKQNIVVYPIRADVPTVIMRVRSRGYDRVSGLFGGRKNTRGAIRFKAPTVSPGYWWWLEFGTSRLRARPFLRPAFESRKELAVLALRAQMQKEIVKIWGKNFKAAA